MYDEIELDGVNCQYCVSRLENPEKSDVARDDTLPAELCLAYQMNATCNSVR
jgi:hypothetical protein